MERGKAVASAVREHELGQQQFRDDVDAILRSVLDSQGDTPIDLRSAIFEHVAGRSGAEEATAPTSANQPVPSELEPLIGKLTTEAYKVVQRELDELLEAGWSEDALFEIIVTAATGAGFGRLERGLAVLQQAKQKGS